MNRQNSSPNRKENRIENEIPVICGRNSVEEALKQNDSLDCLFLQKGEHGGALGRLAKMAGEKGIPVKEVTVQKLDGMTNGANHQGAVLTLAAAEYSTLEDAFRLAESRGEAPFFVLCDGLEDPHNLGAIIRTAECTGVHGIIIPKRRSVSLTAATAKSACGALSYVPVIRVANLPAVMDTLKERGIWLYGAHMQGQDYRKQNYSGGCGLVIGSEGNGISRLVKEKCDVLVSLPMKGKINSLNASVAAGVMLYQIAFGQEK
jgi:23S rRNA (guanosine2251-2'-O)-methyltransferase